MGDKIERLLRKWLRRLPHPFPARDRRRLSLSAVDPAGGVLAHPGARPTGDGAHLLGLLFLLVPGTFRNKDLREHIAPLLGMKPSQLSPGRVTYDLRRLRLHGLIERIPKSHRYRITAKGLRTAIFYTCLYNRLLRTGLAVIAPEAANVNLPLARSIRAAETALNTWYDKANLAA
jgi:hypothetical protein